MSDKKFSLAFNTLFITMSTMVLWGLIYGLYLIAKDIF